MPRDTMLANIQSIQSFFPQDLIHKMWLTPVSEENIEELVARYTSTAFPPVFLPIFERDGNLYTIYLTPGRELQQSPWVLLPDDAVEASIIASSFRYLPLSLRCKAVAMQINQERLCQTILNVLDQWLLR